MINIATPNNAPEDIPVVYGSATGFLIKICITAPLIPSTPPTRIAAIAIGTWLSQTMKLFKRSVYDSNVIPCRFFTTISRDSEKLI